MAWPATGSSFWDRQPGPDALTHWRFQGVEGLRRLTGPQRIVAAEPERFHAELTRAQLDHVALERFSATAHRVERGEREMAEYPTPLLTVIVLLAGTVDVELSDAAFRAGPGEALVLDTRRPVACTMSGDVRMLRSVVGVEHIPAALQRQAATVPGALRRTALLESFAAFIDTILDSTEVGHRPNGPELIAAVSELQAAVLAEAQQIAAYPMGHAGLRYRILEVIEAEHTDPQLDAAGIARRVSTSLRHAHTVFDEGDRTLARVLRDRRAATAAHLLRTEPGAVRLSELARRSGFATREALNRAFASRYGMSPGEYRDRGYMTVD